MTAQEISKLPIQEKLLLMEALWQDMREHFEATQIPPEHKKMLDERRARVASGESSILDWDEVKDRLGKQVGLIQGVKRIEEIVEGRVAGFTEQQFRQALA